MILVDTHAHLHFGRFSSDVDDVVERFKREGGKYLINIGINVEDSEKALKTARKYGFKAAVGVHPHDSKSVPKNYIERLEELAKDKNVVAIGEIGLDYYRNLSPKEVQKKVFIEQIELAEALKKPLIIHVRQAYEDVYEILSSVDLPDPPGVIHAFSADLDWALKFIKLGFMLGIGGTVTYPKNEKLRNVVKGVGIDSILTETDCPYLPPQPFRGRRNEPLYVKYVLEKISDLLNISVEEAGKKILNNAMEVFG